MNEEMVQDLIRLRRKLEYEVSGDRAQLEVFNRRIKANTRLIEALKEKVPECTGEQIYPAVQEKHLEDTKS